METPTQDRRKLVLSIDTGLEGWVSACDYRGVHAIREVPVAPSIKTGQRKNKKTGVKETKLTTQLQWNYPSLIRMLRYARTYATRYDHDLIVVYEDTSVMPFQSVTAGVKQHIGIQMWQIACECLRIPCEAVMARTWKKQVGLTDKKIQSKDRVAEILGSPIVGATHDLAESVLIGYHYLKGDIGWQSQTKPKNQKSKS